MAKRDRQRAKKIKRQRMQKSGKSLHSASFQSSQQAAKGVAKKQVNSSSTSASSGKGSYFTVKKKKGNRGGSTSNGPRNVRVATYTPDNEILVVGDGDFSFSAALHKNGAGSAGRLVATSYDSQKTVLEKYGKEARENLKLLSASGALVLHDVDATELESCPGLFSQEFDRVIFNFPHTGNQRVHENRALLAGFFASVVDYMKHPSGQVHVTLKICKPYVNWDIQKQAESAGLSLMDVVNFDGSAYAGYRHRTTDPEHNESKPLDACKTFVFVNLSE